MKQVLFFLFLGLGLTNFAQSNKVLPAFDYKNAIAAKNTQLVDVRTPEEFKEGHIKNAVNINYMDDNFKSQMEKFDKMKPIYIYCQSGGRSAKAAKILLDMGFKQVFDLKGGFSNWKE